MEGSRWGDARGDGCAVVGAAVAPDGVAVTAAAVRGTAGGGLDGVTTIDCAGAGDAAPPRGDRPADAVLDSTMWEWASCRSPAARESSASRWASMLLSRRTSATSAVVATTSSASDAESVEEDPPVAPCDRAGPDAGKASIAAGEAPSARGTENACAATGEVSPPSATATACIRELGAAGPAVGDSGDEAGHRAEPLPPPAPNLGAGDSGEDATPAPSAGGKPRGESMVGLLSPEAEMECRFRADRSSWRSES